MSSAIYLLCMTVRADHVAVKTNNQTNNKPTKAAKTMLWFKYREVYFLLTLQSNLNIPDKRWLENGFWHVSDTVI